jgi:hypothetical protein
MRSLAARTVGALLEESGEVRPGRVGGVREGRARGDGMLPCPESDTHSMSRVEGVQGLGEPGRTTDSAPVRGLSLSNVATPDNVVRCPT